MTFIPLPKNTEKDAVLVEQKAGTTTLLDADSVIDVNLFDDEGNPYTEDNRLPVDVPLQTTAFDELSISELTPVVQTDFSYNINPNIWESNLNGGTATVDEHRLKLSTGAGTNQGGYLLSRIPIKYSAGQGGLVRFSAIYSTGKIGSSQFIGVGDVADGFLFVCIDEEFGIARFAYGHPEFQTVTITTGSSTAENITVTLDGIASSVPVTASGNVTTTANEIASFDYSLVGQGWLAHAMGDEVIFQNFRSGDKTGAFTVTGTTVVGTFVEILAGVSPEVEFVPQSEWNGNKMSNLDQTKGNIYQIRYQWLGYGPIEFSIEDEDTGKFILIHTLRYGNRNTLPSINNPTLPLVYFVENTTNDTDITVMSGSIGGFIEGKNISNGVRHGISGQDLAVPANTETPILTLHNPIIYEGVPNRTSIRLKFVIPSVDGNKNSIVRIYFNATLTDASFNDVDTGGSVAKFDTAATLSSGGLLLFAFSIEKTGSQLFELLNDRIDLPPGAFITFTVESANTTEAVISLNYEDLF